ncbi:MAG: DivIVA domain-containing protein [Clostridia bacterium]|nr:DivIVA domain-containing protein [Clostridia bacterium]
MKRNLKKAEECKFSIVKMGYDKKEVENYLKTQTERNSILMSENQARLLSMKTKYGELEDELKEFRGREDEIKNSLFAANDKANEMTIDIKIQYALEIERLKIFQAKWTNCYEELKERYHFGKDALNMESVIVSTTLELENLLARDFSLARENSGGEIEKQFKREVERLGGGDEELTSLFEKLKSELKTATKQKDENRNASTHPASKIAASCGEDKFSIIEALNPTQPLEDICKEMGLNVKRDY